MNLFKKIIILVNLILCMLCINVFATITTVEFDGKLYGNEGSFHYVVDLSNVSNILQDYPYYFIYEKYANYYAIVFSKQPLPVLHDGYKSSKYYLFYYVNCVGSYEAKFQMLINPIDNHISIPDTPILIKENSNYNMDIFYFERESLSTGNINYNNNNGVPILYSNYDFVHADSGRVFFENNETPSFDDSTVDWESAFEYYITSRNKTELYSYLDGGYADIMNLYMKPNSLGGLIDNEELHNNNIYYLFKFNVTFKFKQSDGNIHMYPLDVSPIMDIDNYYDLEIPYLVGNIAETPGGNVIYDGLNEFILNGALDKYIVADRIDDSIGIINYDVLVQPYVVKQITYPEYSEEIIYTYDVITVSNNINSENYIKPEESPIIDYPKPNDKDIFVIVSPEGEIIDGIDNSDRYDFGDNWEIIDTWGEDPPIKPVINEETDELEWKDPNGNVTHTVPIGDSIKDDETIREETNKKNYYDIGSIINGLKTDLQELVSNDGSLSKMFSLFRQIFEWLPFDILKIFGMIISFFIVFEFIHIIRK